MRITFSTKEYKDLERNVAEALQSSLTEDAEVNIAKEEVIPSRDGLRFYRADFTVKKPDKTIYIEIKTRVRPEDILVAKGITLDTGHPIVVYSPRIDDATAKLAEDLGVVYETGLPKDFAQKLSEIFIKKDH